MNSTPGDQDIQAVSGRLPHKLRELVYIYIFIHYFISSFIFNVTIHCTSYLQVIPSVSFK